MQVKLYLYRSGMQCKSPWFAVFIRNWWPGICQVRSISITIEREGTFPMASCAGDSRKPNKSMRQFSWSPAHNSHTFFLKRLQELPFEVKIFQSFSLLNSWQISCVFLTLATRKLNSSILFQIFTCTNTGKWKVCIDRENEASPSCSCKVGGWFAHWIYRVFHKEWQK